ncbi:MAG TPA: 6-phosphofructokinase [Flavobacteriales bacterium]|nr:6-phosphofructokinase [Flavobacteriales bacterium]
MVTKPEKLALLTSGGDAPGLNAAIRAVVRTAAYNGIQVIGVQRGYEGLIEGDFMEMDTEQVGNLIHLGGTILKSSRSQKFKTEQGRNEAYNQLKNAGIKSIIILGGDGTFAGARNFTAEHTIQCVGIPKTIDNDLYGSDYTIGFDTAVNTAMRAIDKIRDTAESHNRIFLVEVMGRDAGFIAMHTGLATGAEAILVPETKTTVDLLIKTIETKKNSKNRSHIVVVAEGDEEGGAFDIAEKLKEALPEYDIGTCVLGHIQRGGSPTCNDRILGSKLGAAAVEAIIDGKHNVMVGEINKEIVYTPFEKAVKQHMELNPCFLQLIRMFSA